MYLAASHLLSDVRCFFYKYQKHILEIKTFTAVDLPAQPLYSHLVCCALYLEYYKQSVILLYFTSNKAAVWLLSNDLCIKGLMQTLPVAITAYVIGQLNFEKDYTRKYVPTHLQDREAHVRAHIKYIFKLQEYIIEEPMFI